MEVQTSSNRSFAFLGSLVLAAVLCPAFQAPAAAQYTLTNLDSNLTNAVHPNDKDLINPWGVAYFPGGPFWVSDEGTGESTLYDGSGNKQGLRVTIPSFSGTGTGMPTGIVANSTTDFVISGGGGSSAAFFLFATLDGTIAGWNGGTSAVTVVNNWSLGSSYTGLAMGVNAGANFLYAADNGPNSRVDMFDASFNLVSSFTDPNVPSEFAPFGIQNINGFLYVTFANAAGTGGFVEIFDTAGHHIRHFASGGTLNGPWAVTLASPEFRQFRNALLVGNNGDGRINAFDFTTGTFLGQLKTTAGKTISINNLWALLMGGGSSNDGNATQLFFAAGPNNDKNGVFGSITAR